MTKEGLGEPLPELSDQLDQSRLDEEEDTQSAVEEARRGKVRVVDASQVHRYVSSSSGFG